MQRPGSLLSLDVAVPGGTSAQISLLVLAPNITCGQLAARSTLLRSKENKHCVTYYIASLVVVLLL